MSSSTVVHKNGTITKFDEHHRIKTNISTQGSKTGIPTAAPASSKALQERRENILKAKTKEFSNSKLPKSTVTLPKTKNPKVFVLENYTGLIFWAETKPENINKTIDKIYKHLGKKMPASKLYTVKSSLVEEELSHGLQTRLFVAYE